MAPSTPSSRTGQVGTLWCGSLSLLLFLSRQALRDDAHCITRVSVVRVCFHYACAWTCSLFFVLGAPLVFCSGTAPAVTCRRSLGCVERSALP